MYFTIYVHAQAKKTELVQCLDEQTLKINVAAPAKQGKANQELLSFLSDYFHVPKNSLKITHGKTGKIKRVFVPTQECS